MPFFYRLKDGTAPNFGTFHIKDTVMMTIMLKTACENSYWFKKLHTFKVVVTCVTIYSLVKELSHNALFYDVIGSF